MEIAVEVSESGQTYSDVENDNFTYSLMTLALRTGIFVALVGGAVACCQLFSVSATDPASGIILFLPEDSSQFEVTKGEMSVEEKKWLPADTSYLKRTYKERFLPENEADFRSLTATLIVAGHDSRSLHLSLIHI